MGSVITWIYPEFYIFGEIFVFSFQTILIIGGCVTILGASLYAANVSASGIIIIIGALLGGINIITLWGVRQMREDRIHAKKVQKLDKEDKRKHFTEEVILNSEETLHRYLKENEGKAFTASSLYKRCIEDKYPNISLVEVEKRLHNLHSLGRFHLDVKDNVKYYFI